MSATMRRFHDAFPRLPLLYHGDCVDHENFHPCDEHDVVESLVNEHNTKFHSEEAQR